MGMFCVLRRLALGLPLVLLGPSPRASAFDYDFLPLGGSAKFQAGGGAVTTRGAPSVLYNPANLSLETQSEVYAELTIMTLRYSYEYPGQAPTAVTLTTPVPLLGVSHRLSPSWSLGVVGLVAPAGGPRQAAEGVPSRHFGEEPVLLDVTVGGGRSPSTLFGAGIAFRPCSGFALGLSVTRLQVFSDLEVADHETGAVLGTLEANVVRVVPTLGAHLQLGPYVALGAAADAPQGTKIHVAAQGADGESQNRVGRHGGRERAAVSTTLGRMRSFIEAQHIRHGDDRDAPFDLDPGAEVPVSTHDTINGIAGTSLRTWRRDRIFAAYGWFPSPLGDGVMATSAVDGQERSGVEFGKLDGVSRNVYGLGYEFRGTFGRATCGVAHHRGRRAVPETSRGYGTYSLQIFYAGCESGISF